MNPDIKAQWVAALRSGNYKQGRGRLRREWQGHPGEYQYCCLGVLCELAVEAGIATREDYYYASAVNPNDRDYTHPPVAVERWAGLASSSPQAGERSLIQMNDALADDCYTFSQIADAIERYL